MSEIANDICIRLKVLNPEHRPLGGTVDLEFKPKEGGPTRTVKAVDASKDIDVSGLQRAPKGVYTVTVTPTDVFKPMSQFVTIPASGFHTVEFVINNGGGTQPGGGEGGDGICVRIRTLNPQGRPLGGTVDIEFKPKEVGGAVNVKAADASKDIDVSGLQRAPIGLYAVTVTPTDVFKPTPQFVMIPASGFNTVEFIIDKGGDAQDFVVRGTVRDANGAPLPGIFVRALDRDLRPRHSQQLGGPAVTNDRGFYEIRYVAKDFALAEAGGPDIQVQAFDSRALDRLLGESAVLFNAGNEATIDLTLGAQAEGPSEFETYLAKALPLLKGQADDGSDLRLADLTDADVEFIAAETGIDRQRIAWLRTAAVSEVKLKAGGVSVAIFYGWFRLGLPTDWDQLRVLPMSTLRKTLFDAIEQNIIPAGLRDQVDEVLARFPNQQAEELAILPGVAALPAEKARALLSVADAVEAVSDQVLTRLIEENRFSADDAHAVGLSVSLTRLAGGATDLVSTALDTTFASLQGRKLDRTPDLALLEPADWETVLEKSGATTDASERASQARALAMDAVEAFPHTAFVARATQIPEGIEALLQDIKPLARRNKLAVASDFDALDQSGLGETDRTRLQAAHAELRSFANQHPGLGLHESLSGPDGVAEGARIAQERIGWLRTVFDLNPDVDFLNLDYLPDNPEFRQLKFGELSEEARTLVVQDLKAHRRIHAVTGNVIASRDIMQAGFHAGSVIARMPLSEFVQNSGLPETEARAYYAKARDLGNTAAHYWFRAYEVARDNATSPIRSIPSAGEFFRPLPGFQELINDQPWCNCAHCQSTLSPAAYFVDLMYYIEQNILRDSFKGNERHPLHLNVRRPDLWDLELSCKNTDQYVPYLDLVNEILERYLKEVLPKEDATDLYEFLSRQEGSFKQPFTLPLERLGTLLGHFGLSRYDIAKAMGASREILARTRLNVSQKEFELITSERIAIGELAFFKQLFQITDSVNAASSDTLFPPIEMQNLLRAMDMPHETVEAILNIRFVNEDGSTNPAIKVSLEKRNPEEDVQNNVEWVKNLSLRRLDRIHRFTRLWRKLPWTILELDYVVRHLTEQGLANGIDPDALDRIIDLLELNAKWSLPVDELMSLCDIFPDKGLRGDVSLFDRLFNQSPFLSRDGKWPPNPAIRFTHPSWARNPQGYSAPDNNTLSRLLAGLQLADRELVKLFESLTAVPDLGHQDATLNKDESVAIGQPSLQLLYRHARLMRLLGRNATDFLKLLTLTPRIAVRPAPERYIRDLEDVQSVVRFSEWQETSGFTLDEILYVTRGAPIDGSRDPGELAEDIADAVVKDGSLEFADTVFTELGLTDIQSRKLVADNLSEPGVDRAFESIADGPRFRLKAGFDPATGILTVNDTTISPPLDVALIRSLLSKYYALDILDVTLGRTLDISSMETRALRELAHPLSAADVSDIAAALQGGADRRTLVNLVGAALRYRALFKNPVFDLAGLRFVKAKPAVFALTNDPATRTITTDVVQSAASYVALAVPRDLDFTSASTPIDLETLQTVLGGVAGASDADIAKVLGIDRARISALKPHLTLPAQPFDALDNLARCLALTELLGVSGETLGLMINEESTAAVAYQKLSRAAEDVFAAFRAKYPLEKTFQEKMEPYEDKLRARKRDALVDFLVRKWPEPFSDPNKLYAYFLIDVLLEGCARTSRIVAAISSLQLYVQRVIMHLEFSSDGAVYARFSNPSKQNEWYWRQHYRVWEANRKVFLYPENYIEPGLRDDKTPPFKELEDTLLQGEINDLNARDAYAKYLDGFDEVARLKIAGAYYDYSLDENKEVRDTLHLFGVTSASPPSYYYRVIDRIRDKNPKMSAWKKLNLRIPAPKVSPVACDGRLYLFWLETNTRAVTKFTGGNSDFSGYRHFVRVKYSTLRADGTWTEPQSLRFSSGGVISDGRAVNDPRSKEQVELKNQISALSELVDKLSTNVTNANKELGLRSKEFNEAQAALAKPLTLEEEVKAGPIREGVRITYATTYGASLILTPPVAERLAIEAALGVMTASVPGSSVNSLKAAGVIVGPIQIDAYQIAQRKHDVYFAALNVQIAQNNLAIAQQILAPFQRQLDQLKAQDKAITVKWDKSGRDHTEPVDDYMPQGWEWDRIYPDVFRTPPSSAKVVWLVLAPSDDDQNIFPFELDQPAGVLREINPGKSHWYRQLLRNTNGSIREFWAYDPVETFYYATRSLNTPASGGNEVAIVPLDADLQVVNGDTASLIIESRGDVAWLRSAPNRPFSVSRLSTTLTAGLISHFARRDDLSGLLDAGIQETLKESHPNIQAVAGRSRLDMPEDPFDPDNDPSHPYLTYLRETFFHIPFLVANHLNGEQKFAQAQRWYHYIFNPTVDGDPWRYRELQLAPRRSLRALLTDGDALAAYRADPFNPHAIARTRLSAYQKAIVMKYVDNLLDWGDALFSQFTMESVNEATMLYVMAQEILGPRPPELGSCGEGKVTPRNYQKIREGLNEVSDFLIELESSSSLVLVKFTPRQERTTLVIQHGATRMSRQEITVAGGQPAAPRFARMMTPATPVGASTAGGVVVGTVAGVANVGAEFDPGGSVQAGASYWTNVDGTPLSNVYMNGADGLENGSKILRGIDPVGPRLPGTQTPPIDFENPAGGFTGNTFGVGGGGKITLFDQAPPFTIKYTARDIQLKEPRFKSLTTGFQPIDLVPPSNKNPVFCIPPNADLIAYWDRVEDRLFKIRNCMDIAGVRRRLELFAPEIDPRLLVRMKAAGLTLDDVLNSISGNVPPYRFTYLIDKAKQFAGTLQNFGAQLLSALEKRDGEELSRLRAVHEQNLLSMRKRMTKLEIDAAQDTIESLELQKDAAIYRQNHFRSLSEVGLTPAEQTQQARQKEASQFRTMASVAQYLAGILSIIPDVGAPTAMKFGGSQLGAAGRSIAEGLNAIAGFNEMAASAAGMEASNQRRDQEWKHQAETDRRNIPQIEKQITAAKFRKEIAEEAQKVHEKTIAQAEEVFNLLRDKFSGYDRYTFLSKRLRELYRVAYKSALSMARMAEQAFSAERNDDETRLTGDYWDAENFGLLAGERLLSNLHVLEQQYIEKNYRQLEIEQSFSLAQFAPDLLTELRQEGQCQFVIPELFFDLTYPGHYRRRLKAVRLTIPCVIGPHTNIGATLRLVNSSIRLKPFDQPASVPLRHTVSIAASKGQYDSGVLDFNFRDERYMPFEGAGALSAWDLSLPETIRVFDYNTISDVILHLSYTAEFDGKLRDSLESEERAQMARLLEVLRAKDPDPEAPETDPDPQPPLTRVFSLRYDFPDVFSRLVGSPANTEITFSIEQRHFPFFLVGRALKATHASLKVISPLSSLATAGDETAAAFAIRQKVEPTPPRGFRDLKAQAGTIPGEGMKAFDFGDVLSRQAGEPGGITPDLLGEYLIVLRRAGPLAPDQGQGGRAVDPEKLHDVLITVGYGLA